MSPQSRGGAGGIEQEQCDGRTGRVFPPPPRVVVVAYYLIVNERSPCPRVRVALRFISQDLDANPLPVSFFRGRHHDFKDQKLKSPDLLSGVRAFRSAHFLWLLHPGPPASVDIFDGVAEAVRHGGHHADARQMQSMGGLHPPRLLLAFWCPARHRCNSQALMDHVVRNLAPTFTGCQALFCHPLRG